jgi:hypothetical protein
VLESSVYNASAAQPKGPGAGAENQPRSGSVRGFTLWNTGYHLCRTRIRPRSVAGSMGHCYRGFKVDRAPSPVFWRSPRRPEVIPVHNSIPTAGFAAQARFEAAQLHTDTSGAATITAAPESLQRGAL